MGASITFKDLDSLGSVYHHSSLWIECTRISLRELISQRVRQEVEKINSINDNSAFHSLIQPKNTEIGDHGYAFTSKKQVDADEQIALALLSFNNNGYFVLVDDVQVENLDDEVEITGDTIVSFLKLVQLVGG